MVFTGKLAHLSWPRLPQLVAVDGPSMEPLLADGAWALLLPWPGRMPRLGQVVVAEHPAREGFEVIKRVAAVSREGDLVWLAGDNRERSSDSDQFGPISRRQVVGPVVAVLRPGRPRLIRVEPARLWG
jgi:nickel-type superoxide dismutase maturation protease